MEQDKLTRRKFVASTAGVAMGAMIVPRHVLGGTGFIAPSDKLNVAVIGCGGQGASDATELVTAGENIVALADVDFGYVDKAVANSTKDREGKPNEARVKLQEAYNKAKRYADYRQMLDQQKDIDAVIVATPDHIHAIAAKHSLEAGKHVYCEKPLTWSVQESRVLRETAAKYPKLATQMGNQGHSNDEARLINEWIQAGVIGPVKEVFVWTNRPIWPQGVPRPAKVPVNPEGGGFGNDWTARLLSKATASALSGFASTPPTLNWDLYLGPAPEVEFHPIYHPFNWRGWVDWGTGALGDMAAHLIDHPYWALDLRYPDTIEATSSPWGEDNKRNPVSHPLVTQVVYNFPARGNQPPVKMIWCDGGLMAPRPSFLPDNIKLERGGGVIFVGSKGMLMHETYGEKPRLFPESLMETAKKVPQKIERNPYRNDKDKPLHRVQFANACKGKAKPVCPFEYASRLTETMLLGIVALKTGQGELIRWDGEAGKVTNNDKANQHLHREYRKGWKL